MPDVSDMELVQNYNRQGSEEAFAELVRRHIDLVYSTAWRHIGIAAYAEEITQAVFIILARKAASLRPDTVLEAWLYETTRLTSLSFQRGERRRQFREQEAYMQSTLQESADVSVWNQLAPLLDEAMARLGSKDREAVVLRFFKEKSLSEVAVAMKTTEAAAQSRVHRAVEKLRLFFTKRGIVHTAEVLTATISTHSIQTAPAMLAKAVTTMALAKGATAGGSTLTLIKGALKLMAWTNAKTAIVISMSVLLAAGTATVAVKKFTGNSPEAWQEKYDLSVLDRLPPEVKILPSLPSTLQTHLHIVGVSNGKGLGLGQSISDLISIAWSVKPILNVPLPEGKYDVIATLPKEKDNLTAVQNAIKNKFGLTVRREAIETNVLLLTVQSPDAAGLRPAVGSSSGDQEPDSYSAHGQPIYPLVVYLERCLGTVVINQTQLTGTYDIDFKWDSTPKGLKQVLLDQLGLKLTPSRQAVIFAIVEKAGGQK